MRPDETFAKEVIRLFFNTRVGRESGMKRTGFSKKRVMTVMLAIMVTMAMTPLGVGAAFADDNGKTDSGKEAKKSDVIKEIKETGIDAGSLGIANDKDADAPAITTEDGAYVSEDMVPAVTEPSAPKKESKAKAGKTIKGYPSEYVDPTTAIIIASKQKKHCVVETDDQTFTYKFVAPKSGTFFFYSEGSLDSVGRIMEYDSATDSYTNVGSDDSSGPDENFRIGFNAVSGKTYYLLAKLYYSDNRGEFDVVVYPDEYTATISVSNNKSTGKATVTGKATGDTFDDIYVDGSREYAGISGQSSFTKTIDMKNYSVGFHTISAKLSNHDAQVVYKYAVPTYIYSKPSIKRSDFTTSSKYFVFNNSGNYYSNDSNCGVYLDFKKKGNKKWKNNYGPVASGNSGKKTGLKPSTFYYVRAHYGKKVSYGGKTYFFTGKDTGKKTGNIKIKTGNKKKPLVKKIKISKVKQYKKTFSYTLWINYGGYMVPRYITNTYWYTSFRCTVYLKKKPKAAGIYIGNVKVKGNKKKYTADFTVTGKQKGKKLKFSVCSYQNTTYKGYSPYYKKKVRIK